MRIFSFVVAVLLSCSVPAHLAAPATAAPPTSGTAPGGFEVVNTPGSALSLWMQASAGKNTTGSSINSWTDQSKNAYTATALTTVQRPIQATETINGQNVDVVRFVEHATLANRDSLSFGLPTAVPNIPRGDHTIFFIADRTGGITGSTGNIIGFDKTGSRAEDNWYYKFINAGPAMEAGTNGNNFGYQLLAGDTGGFLLASGRYSSTETLAQLFVNGGLSASETNAAATLNLPANTRLNIGAFDTPITGSPTGFENHFVGDIAQIVLFNRPLNTAERVLVENALSAEYRLPLTANDFYSGDTPAAGAGMRYDQGLFGIGGASDGSQVLSGGKDGMGLEAASLGQNQWALAAHEAGDNAIVQVNDPGALVEHWQRDWFIDVTSGGAIDASLYFNFDDAGLPGLYDPSNDYVLAYAAQQGDPWQALSPLSGLVGDTLMFNVSDLQTGFYTLGVQAPEVQSVPEPAAWVVFAVVLSCGIVAWRWVLPQQQKK